MELESFKKKNVTWVRALGTDKTLFKHCAENQNEVTMSKYTATVQRLLFLHGAIDISLTHRHNRD